MVFRIQGEFRCGPGVDQEDVLRVTPNCAGYLTSEKLRHRTHPFPLMLYRLHRSFDPRWKSLQSAPPYPNRKTIRPEVPRPSLPGNREVQPFPPRIAVDVCCSSSFLQLPPALARLVRGLPPLAV